jgi:Helix-hairpin-helix domain
VTEIPHRVGAPARRAFAAAGYTSLEELLAADEKELLALHGVGPRAIRIVHEAARKR